MELVSCFHSIFLKSYAYSLDDICEGCWSRDDREIESKKKLELELENEPEFDGEDDEEELKLLETGELMLRPPCK